jgi:hypothetical protein
MMIQYTAQQGLIPHAFAVDELFDDLTRTLARVRGFALENSDFEIF